MGVFSALRDTRLKCDSWVYFEINAEGKTRSAVNLGRVHKYLWKSPGGIRIKVAP